MELGTDTSSSKPSSSASGATKRAVGRPPAYKDKGPANTAIIRNRMKVKLLKNKARAKDVLDDTLAIWRSGTDMGNLVKAKCESYIHRLTLMFPLIHCLKGWLGSWPMNL